MKKPTFPEFLAAHAASETESRKQSRQDLRERLAKNELVDIRIREIQSLKTANNARLESATSQHSAKTEPIQTALGEVEEQIVKAMAATKPHADLTINRRDLLSRLDEANKVLEAAAAECSQRGKSLDKQIAEERTKRDREVYPDLLLHPSYANPVWKAEWSAWQQIATVVQSALDGVNNHNRDFLRQFHERGTKNANKDVAAYQRITANAGAYRTAIKHAFDEMERLEKILRAE